MNKILLVILTISISVFSFSQEKIIKGIVTDSLNKPIQYANIGILNKPIGTVSNQNGEYFLNIDNSMNLDTLKISCLGYKTVEKVINNIQNNNFNISLENHFVKLEEVVIKSDNLKTYIEGKEKSNSKNQVFFAIQNRKDLNLGSEIGRKFTLGTKKPSLLKEFKFFVKENNFDRVKFRINIYTILNNRPDKKINETNIIVGLENKNKGWVDVDLSEYEIKTQQDIIVAVEWIECSKVGDKLSLPILIPSFSSTHYYKFGTQAKWEKYGRISSSMVLTFKQ